MTSFPQDVYARNLLSHRGYPLWIPEPSVGLPSSYREEGLKIGDVGVVVPEEGSFDVFFNVTLPQEHPLHEADDVPNNFAQIKLKSEDFRIISDAESPGDVISSPATRCTVNCTDTVHLDGAACRLTEYQFTLCRNEGAMLILPQGAERHRLAKELLLLDVVIQNAVEWYRFAREQLYRDISSDALYLVTGYHKARSWSLASFQGDGASSAHCKIVQQRKAGPMLVDDSAWESDCPLERRIGPRRSVTIPNQSVFITGFKIAVNEELLHLKRVTVKVEHSKRTLATKLVGSGASLANLLFGSIFHGSQPSETDSATGGTSESTPEHHPPEDEHERVRVKRVPQQLQPFHPSDIINRYMLKMEPSARVAITHDSHWISLLEKRLLKEEDILQEGRLEAVVSQEYKIITKDGVAHLQSIEVVSLRVSEGTPLQKAHSWTMSANNGPTKNVALVGLTGVGKSTLVNILTGSPHAQVDNEMRPRTTRLDRYDIVHAGVRYSLWDTRRLNGPVARSLEPFRALPNMNQELHEFLRGGDPKIDLILFCVDADKIRVMAQWKNFGRIYIEFCSRNTKVAVLVTQMDRNTLATDWRGTCVDMVREVTGKYILNEAMVEAVPASERLRDSWNSDQRILGLISTYTQEGSTYAQEGWRQKPGADDFSAILDLV